MEPVERAALGKYTLVAEIARGGMGIVYLANAGGPGGFNKLVVLKQLKPELGDDENFRDMFLEEARLAARLNHRNIVQTNEVSQEGDRIFMAMDYLEGCSLHSVHKRLKGNRRPALAMELRVLSEVLAGLHYAHELADYDGTPLGVVHRDVGPQNIYLTFDGQVKLLDFGVAKVLNREQQTQAGVLKGRVAYMAPEQVGGTTIDRRVDIFAVGVVLRERLTGVRLWEGMSEINTLKQLINRTLPPFPEGVEVAPELRAICEKAMDPDREARFKTAHEMRVAIEQHVLRLDPGGSLADLGSHLARELAAERKHLKELIDAHITGDKGSVPSLDFPMLPSSSPDLSVSKPSKASVVSASGRRAPKTPASGTVVAGDVPEAEIAVEATDGDPKSSHRRGLLYAGVGVAIVAVVASGVVLRRNAQRASTEPVAATALVASTVVSPPPPAASHESPPQREETIEVSVRVTPANAQVFIDDAAVEGNPFRARFPRNGTATHTVRAVAPSFAPKTEIIRFDANANVTMSLDRVPTGAVAAAPPPRVEARPAAPAVAALVPTVQAPAPTPARASTDLNPRGGKAPKREVDPKNPYGAE